MVRGVGGGGGEGLMIRWGRLISRESYILFKQLVHNILSYMVIFITGKSLLALTTRIF